MKFRITVAENTPLTPLSDLDDALIEFLCMIEYLPKGYKPRTGVSHLKESIPYKMFKDHILMRPDRGWTIDELAVSLGTSRVTIYRHIKKLLGLGLVEKVKKTIEAENGSVVVTAYKLAKGDILAAWLNIEENINNAVRNYRVTVEHIKNLSLRVRR